MKQKRGHRRDLGCYFVLPEDRIAEGGAGDSDGCRFDGSECFKLQLLLVLSTQFCLCSIVGLFPHLWLQVIWVVPAPSYKEHSAQKKEKDF